MTSQRSHLIDAKHMENIAASSALDHVINWLDAVAQTPFGVRPNVLDAPPESPKLIAIEKRLYALAIRAFTAEVTFINQLSKPQDPAATPSTAQIMRVPPSVSPTRPLDQTIPENLALQKIVDLIQGLSKSTSIRTIADANASSQIISKLNTILERTARVSNNDRLLKELDTLGRDVKDVKRRIHRFGNDPVKVVPLDEGSENPEVAPILAGPDSNLQSTPGVSGYYSDDDGSHSVTETQPPKVTHLEHPNDDRAIKTNTDDEPTHEQVDSHVTAIGDDHHSSQGSVKEEAGVVDVQAELTPSSHSPSSPHQQHDLDAPTPPGMDVLDQGIPFNYIEPALWAVQVEDVCEVIRAICEEGLLPEACKDDPGDLPQIARLKRLVNNLIENFAAISIHLPEPKPSHPALPEDDPNATPRASSGIWERLQDGLISTSPSRGHDISSGETWQLKAIDHVLEQFISGNFDFFIDSRRGEFRSNIRRLGDKLKSFKEQQLQFCSEMSEGRLNIPIPDADQGDGAWAELRLSLSHLSSSLFQAHKKNMTVISQVLSRAAKGDLEHTRVTEAMKAQTTGSFTKLLTWVDLLLGNLQSFYQDVDATVKGVVAGKVAVLLPEKYVGEWKQGRIEINKMTRILSNRPVSAIVRYTPSANRGFSNAPV